MSRLPSDPITGAIVPMPDHKAADPADAAASREQVRGLARLAAELPPPAVVAARAAAYRAAVFAAVRPEDVTAIVAAQVGRAVGGNRRAAEFVLELVGAKAAAVAPVQAVQVNIGDVG
jgi:hypothetical protein